MTHWMENVEHVTSGDWRILGECDNGDLWVPTKLKVSDERFRWGTRFRWWNPRHWSFYLRSRLTGRVAFLERES